MDKLQIGLIFGGRSGEHAVSLQSARAVLGALDPNKYAVTEIGITTGGAWLIGEKVLEAMEATETSGLQSATILPYPADPGLYGFQETDRGVFLERVQGLDVVFPVLHGTFGEDGTLQGLLELAGIAYVGAGVLGSALGMDKAAFKDVMIAHDIPVLESVLLLRSAIDRDLEMALTQAEDVSPYPLFTKPANLGSSVGVSKCNHRADLVEGIMEAAQYDRRILVERGIDGREIEVSVLGNDEPEASIPGEVLPAAEFYSYEAKYHDARSELVIPAQISEEIQHQVQSLAVRAYQAIDCAGLARVDFLLDRQGGGLYLNELNTMPGFTEISMYPKLWDASGLTYPALVDRLVNLALERRADRARTKFVYRRDG
jgi:D-alanine-D-alanine ligase